MTLPGLLGWLDRKLRHPAVQQSALTAWIRKALVDAEAAGNPLDVLFRGKFLLLRKLAELFAAAQEIEGKRGYQLLLADSIADMDDEFAFRFPRHYPARWVTPGTYRFQKHFYPRPGEMRGKGEEFECAIEIDRLEEVLYWVRNLAGPGEERERGSFWLQTWRGRFYPDFVAQLKDGRTLVVEYKGREDEYDAEKDELGRQWADRSGQKAVFLTVYEHDDRRRSVKEQLLMAIAGQQKSIFARA